jgi:tRNA(fMet)-specific endonuclease VapC
MIYLPDTNVFSAYLADKSPELTRKMRAAFAAGELRLSVMVVAELSFGAEKARLQFGESKFFRRLEKLGQQLEIEQLGPEFPAHYAKTRAHLESTGQKIGDRDTIIAAHALTLRAVLVTRNIDEFSRVPGLTVENWADA